MKRTHQAPHSHIRTFHLPAGVIAFLHAICHPRIATRLVFAVLALCSAQFSFAEPWDEAAESTYDAVMSVIRWVALIAIVVMGILMMTGNIAAKTAVMIIAGIAVTVGGEAIYDYFEGAIG